MVRVLLRLPQEEVQRGAGGRVGADLHCFRHAGQPFEQRAGVRHRRRCSDEHRVGTVVVGQPTEASQHGSDVGAEHAAVAVRLVDHHITQRGQQPRPLLVAGQYRAVQHVGIREHEPAEVARETSLHGIGVAVQRAHPPARQAEGFAHPQLVVGECLGRREVDRRVAAAQLERTTRGNLEPEPGFRRRSQDREQVAESLA